MFFLQYFRLDKLLTPEEVASAIVDGVQKNKKAVFVPKSMSLVTVLAKYAFGYNLKYLHRRHMRFYFYNSNNEI